MILQFSLLFTFFIAVIFGLWFRAASKRVYKDRLNTIEEKVKSMGGSVVNIEHVKRENCFLKNDYNDPDFFYRFYKIIYYIKDKQKEGWAIAAITVSYYGGTANRLKWIWNL